MTETATKEELLALTARMRAVANKTYDLFFRAGMGGDVHAFIEFCGVLSKYVDICERCAEQGIDFRMLNTHSNRALPVFGHDMVYLGEKLDCIFGPAIRGNPEAGNVLRQELFGHQESVLDPVAQAVTDSLVMGLDEKLSETLRWARIMRADGFHVIVRDAEGRVLNPDGSVEGSA